MKTQDHDYCLPDTLCIVIGLQKLNEHYCLTGSSLTWWQEKQLLMDMEKLDQCAWGSLMSWCVFIQIELSPPGLETTMTQVTRNVCLSPLYFCSAGSFPNWERLASCKHRWQPSMTERGESGLEAQLLHGKAVWSWVTTSKACTKYSPQNSLTDSFIYSTVYWVSTTCQLLCQALGI